MPGRPVSASARARILELAAKGVQQEAIADRTGTSPSTVKRVLAEQRRADALRKAICE